MKQKSYKIYFPDRGEWYTLLSMKCNGRMIGRWFNREARALQARERVLSSALLGGAGRWQWEWMTRTPSLRGGDRKPQPVQPNWQAQAAKRLWLKKQVGWCLVNDTSGWLLAYVCSCRDMYSHTHKHAHIQTHAPPQYQFSRGYYGRLL